MIGLDTSAEAKRRLADRAVLVGVPVGLTWLSLRHTARYFGAVTVAGLPPNPEAVMLARLTALAIGVVVGGPIALAAVRYANGWGIETAEDADEPRDA